MSTVMAGVKTLTMLLTRFLYCAKKTHTPVVLAGNHIAQQRHPTNILRATVDASRYLADCGSKIRRKRQKILAILRWI